MLRNEGEELIPVSLGMNPSAKEEHVVGSAKVTDYGTLQISIPFNELTQRIAKLESPKQIVNVYFGVQYTLDIPSKE